MHALAAAVASKQPIYKPPSSSTAATELEALSRYSVIVPDTVLMQEVEQLELQAATVSSGVLRGIMRNPAGLHEYEVCQCPELVAMSTVLPDRPPGQGTSCH